MTRNRFCLFLMSLCLFIAPTSAQIPIPITNLLEIEIINAGYGGMYRSDEWFPVQVRISNSGVNFSGRVVVRPETTIGVNNTYSVAIPELSAPLSPDNPTIAQTTLYMIGQDQDLNLYIELINDQDVTVASNRTFVRHIAPADRIYTVISPRSINLISAVTANASALQSTWTLANIPAQQGTMGGIDVLVLDDVDTTPLTARQAETLEAWVLNGGHLIISGDSNLGGLSDDLSPFKPDGLTTTDDFTALERFTKRGDVPRGEALITTGTATGRILAQAHDETPLIIRHEFGHGTVDYLTFSPTLAPLNQWRGTPALFFTLFTTTQKTPPWAYGFFDWTSARTALEIMPGLSLLPSVWSLIAFLGAYIVVVGPINYVVLSWVNRRDYAWFTIPLSILLFSFLAYTLGFELRGEVVTLNQLNVVQSWTNTNQAQVDQLTGLLSPQRGTYHLSSGDNLLRPLGEQIATLNLDRQSSVEIQQSNQFEAKDFTVDASFMMGFATQGMIPRPQINGAVTVMVEPNGNKTLRGYIENDLPFTLNNPTLITAGMAHHLGDQLADGLTDISIIPTLQTHVTESASPSNQEHIYNRHMISHNRLIRSRQTNYIFSNQADLLPQNYPNDVVGMQRFSQSNYLLQALLQDQYATTARTNRVFLIGWSDQAILNATLNINRQQIRELNTTLYIIELESDYQTQDQRTITQDQFTWTTVERAEATFAAPVFLDPTYSEPLAFRFSPQPNAILEDVERLTVIIDRATVNTWRGALEIWNWETQDWERFETTDDEFIIIDHPTPYLGALNSVEVRTILPVIDHQSDGFGTPTVNRIGIMQSGS